MHVNPHPAGVQPYRSSLYLPGSLARFRQYPRVVTTPIPGAGYKVGKGVWGEQVLYLGGYGDLFKVGRTYPYGQYASVPLRGLGQVAWVVPPDGLGQTAGENRVLWVLAGLGMVGVLAYNFRPMRRNRRRRRS